MRLPETEIVAQPSAEDKVPDVRHVASCYIVVEQMLKLKTGRKRSKFGSTTSMANHCLTHRQWQPHLQLQPRCQQYLWHYTAQTTTATYTAVVSHKFQGLCQVHATQNFWSYQFAPSGGHRSIAPAAAPPS